MFTKLNLECWYEIPVIAIERGENDDYDLIRVAGP